VPLLAMGGFEMGEKAVVEICGGVSDSSRVVAARSDKRPIWNYVRRNCTGMFF